MSNRIAIIKHLSQFENETTLRSMSDEELCELFSHNMEHFNIYDFCRAYVSHYQDMCRTEERCVDCLLDWIKEN